MTFPKAINWKNFLICLSLFLFFLLIHFPYQNLRGWVFSKIYEKTKILMMAQEMRPAFLGWPGIAMHHVDVTIPVSRRDELNLTTEKMVFRVGLGGLFPPAPAVSLNLQGLEKGGDLYLKLRKGGDKIGVSLEADEVNLSQINFSELSTLVEGSLDADAKMEIDESDLEKSTGKIEIKAGKLKTSPQSFPGFVLPELNIDNFKTAITVKNGVAEFTDVRFGDKNSDISGTVKGKIKLGRDLPDSHLDIALRFQFSEAFTANPDSQNLIANLSAFRSQKDGSFSLAWNARISEMQSDPYKAIPTRADTD